MKYKGIKYPFAGLTFKMRKLARIEKRLAEHHKKYGQCLGDYQIAVRADLVIAMVNCQAKLYEELSGHWRPL